MATRVYFPSTGSAPISPSIHSNWTNTATGFIRRPLNVSGSKSNTNLSDREWDINDAFVDWCAVQFVSSQRLEAQTISGSVDLGIMASSSATGATYVACRIRIVTSGGSTRATLLEKSDNTNQIGVSGDPSYQHEFYNSLSLSSGNAQEGDYLVIELGVYATNSTLKTVGLKIGDDTSYSNVSSDSSSETLATGSALFSDTITFISPPTDLTYTYTSNVDYIKEAIPTNTPTYSDGGGTITYALQSGTLPAGVSLNTSTGTITGTPTEAGVFPVVVRVSNLAGSADSPTITYTVERRPNSTLRLNDISHMKMRIG